MKEIINIPMEPYSVGLNHDVEYKRVRACRRGEGNDTLFRGLYLQIMIPRPEDRTKPQGPYPVVIYSPGGGWKVPLVRYRLPIAVDLAKRGFVVVMVEYRGREYFNDWREPISDVRSAIRYVTKHAAQYCVDPNNIFLFGDSAGAHLSMMAAYTGDEFDDPEDDVSIPVHVQGVMELFGPTDLVRMNEGFYRDDLPNHPVWGLMRDTMTDLVKCNDLQKVPELLAPINVTDRISPEAEIPPTLIAQGDNDIMVPSWSADVLYELLQKAGKEAEYYLLNGARHGDMRFYGKEMMDRYERFIRKNMK